MGDVGVVVTGYVDLADTLVQGWGQLASNIAAQLDAGSMTADEATSDFAAATALAMQSFVLIVNEAFDAAAVLQGTQHLPVLTTPQTFSAPPTAAMKGAVRTLQLAGPLTWDFPGDLLPPSVVTITPSELPDGQVDFTLQADGTGHRAGCYRGGVDVFDQSGAHTASVAVFVVV